ncbi:1156_t:CDS:2, partial [Racocetra persica]
MKKPSHNWVCCIEKLAIFDKILTYDNLQEQIISATFLAEDNNKTNEDSEVKDIEYNPNIIEYISENVNRDIGKNVEVENSKNLSIALRKSCCQNFN